MNYANDGADWFKDYSENAINVSDPARNERAGANRIRSEA